MVRFFTCVMLVLFPASMSMASVISGGDSGHTTAPADDPGWARIGRVGSLGSGVYVGNGWVLTANHVASSYFTVEGDKTYNVIAGSGNTKQLRNTTDTGYIDLYMFRVSVQPSDGLYGLADMNIATALKNNGSNGTHIGTGEGQTSSVETTWYVDTDHTGKPEDPWVWKLYDFPEADSEGYGYYWGGDATRDTRWDTQQMYNNNCDFNGMEGFETVFVDSAGYGMVADNDSGSPIFFKTGTTWYLSGIAIAVDTYPQQPGGTGIYGDGSLYVDLTAYRQQILDTMAVPEPATIFVIGGGMAGLMFYRKRRRK